MRATLVLHWGPPAFVFASRWALLAAGLVGFVVVRRWPRTLPLLLVAAALLAWPLFEWHLQLMLPPPGSGHEATPLVAAVRTASFDIGAFLLAVGLPSLAATMERRHVPT